MNKAQTNPDLHLADPLSRLGANLLDSFIAFVVTCFAIMFMVTILSILKVDTEIILRFGVMSFIALPIIIDVYNRIYYSYTHEGASMGKGSTNIRVVNIDGSTPSLVKLLLRYIVYNVLAFFLSIFAFITIFFTPKKQTIGDMILGMMVVKKTF